MGCCDRIIHGVVGLTQSALGINSAPDDVIQQRRELCRACPEATTYHGDPTRFSQCRVCKCFLKAKTQLQTESCPLGKWLAFAAVTSEASD